MPDSTPPTILKRDSIHPTLGTTTITSKGQITIPYRIRDWLGIKPGQPIAIAIAGEDLHFTLLPRNTKPMTKTRNRKEAGGSCTYANCLAYQQRPTDAAQSRTSA